MRHAWTLSEMCFLYWLLCDMVRVFSCSETLLQEKMFSGVAMNTTLGSPVASESALSAPSQRSREERDATGRAVASRLGLAWPLAKRIRRPGRPTVDAQWCDALQNWTRDVAFGHHDDDLRVQRERPRGWRPGDAMVPAAPSSHIELAGVSASAASDPREKEEECTVITYHRSSHVVRRWATWYAVTRGERGVPTVAIVHELIDQWPDVFGSWLTAHLLRRWVRKPVPHRVRPDEGLLPMLSEVVQKIYSAGVPMSARGFQLLFNELAAEHGFPSTHFGRNWTYRFLHELGMRYRKAQSAKVRDIPPDVLEREERALLRKMVWLECTHEVPPERVFNLDETALTVLMLSPTGWAKINDAKDKIRFLGSDEKRVITLTLVVSRKGDMSAQIIFGGKTSRVHPDAPPPDWCLYSHSENHWTSVTTLQEICQFMSDKVHGEKFIMLMDLCPVHCCRDFLDWSHEALPNMLLAFVPPGMTAQLQPLDRAYMRTVKNEIRKAASRSLAHDVIAAHRSGTILQLDMRLPALRPRLVNWVTTAHDATEARPEICELAWRHLTVSPIQYAAVYREACAHHDEGTLFHKIEPDPLEAECKDEEGDEIFGEPGAAVEICDPAMEPPEPVLDAAPTEEETVEQLHSLSREAKALRRCSMLKALYGSFASKGPR